MKTMLIKVAIPNQVQLKLIPDFSTLFMSRQKELHYIGGAEVLPAPLNQEEEAAAIGRLGTAVAAKPEPCSLSIICGWWCT